MLQNTVPHLFDIKIFRKLRTQGSQYAFVVVLRELLVLLKHSTDFFGSHVSTQLLSAR